jgi:hypothetical protein
MDFVDDEEDHVSINESFLLLINPAERNESGDEPNCTVSLQF